MRGSEYENLAWENWNFLACFWITAGSLALATNDKTTERRNLDSLADGQGVRDLFKDRFNQ